MLTLVALMVLEIHIQNSKILGEETYGLQIDSLVNEHLVAISS